MTWLGWSLTNRKNPITSFTTLVSDSSVAIGIQGSAPESLDIRTEQGTALEQALLENVYETLVSRSETNKLQPSIAKSWQISDDGLTYTFTLNSNMTFANGLNSTRPTWSGRCKTSSTTITWDPTNLVVSRKSPIPTKKRWSSPSISRIRACCARERRAGIVYE